MNLLARFLGGLGERMIAVVFAVAAAQFPLYYSDYSDVIAGAQEEAQLRYLELQGEAQQVHLQVEQFVQRHEVSADPVFQASGRIHRTTLEHYTRYTAMLTELRSASVWDKPLVFERNFDRDFFDATEFEPGLELSAESAGYAFIGLLLAYLLTGIIGALLPRTRRRSANSF